MIHSKATAVTAKWLQYTR